MSLKKRLKTSCTLAIRKKRRRLVSRAIPSWMRDTVRQKLSRLQAILPGIGLGMTNCLLCSFPNSIPAFSCSAVYAYFRDALTGSRLNLPQIQAVIRRLSHPALQYRNGSAVVVSAPLPSFISTTCQGDHKYRLPAVTEAVGSPLWLSIGARKGSHFPTCGDVDNILRSILHREESNVSVNNQLL
nr:hypothetical protein, expressed [Toxoplasma gondii RH]